MSDTAPKVVGRCPACHRTELTLTFGDVVTCSALECGNPTLVADLLGLGLRLHALARSGQAVANLQERRSDLTIALGGIDVLDATPTGTLLTNLAVGRDVEFP